MSRRCVIIFASFLVASGLAHGQCNYTASYPSSVATDANLFVARDGIQTSLSAAMAAGDAIAVVKNSTGWAINMIATVESEKMLVTAVATNVLTVSRAFGGTSAASHASGKLVSAFINCDHHEAMKKEVQAIETALGTNLSNIPSAPVTNSAGYNFSAYSCDGSATCTVGGSSGMSLIAGNNTLTMRPVPLGVAGSHTLAAHLPHLLYVSGGVGTAEACAISGGSGTSGQASGQIIINCANTHSGAWTLASNTTGVQEAVYAAGPTGRVSVAGGVIDLWANICTGAQCATADVAALTIPDGYSTSVRGQGVGATTFRTHQTTGAWIREDYFTGGSAGISDLGDFSITDNSGTFHTSGQMVHAKYHGDGVISHIFANYCYDCYFAEGEIHDFWQDLTGGASHYGLKIGCAGVNYPTCLSYGTYSLLNLTSLGSGAHAIHIEAPTAGIIIDSPFLGAVSNTGNVAIYIAANGTDPLNEIQIGGACIIDGHAAGVEVMGNGSSYVSNSITVSGCRINSATYGVYAASYVSGLMLSNNVINSALGVAPDRAILLSQTQNTQIQNNHIGSDGDAGLLLQTANTNVDFTGNVVGVEAGLQPTTAVSVGGTVTGFRMRNNVLSGASGAYTSGGLTPSGFAFSANAGIDDVIPSVASAATLAFPVNPTFTITGTTNVTAVSMVLAAGARGTFVPTGGTITFTAGASIGNSFIAKQNVPVTWYWDGTLMWLGGQVPTLANSFNYIASETGANNAIAGTLTGVTLGAGLTVTVQLAHTLQAGANTFNLNGGGALNIKSSRNAANDIGTAYAATGQITLRYDGTQWVDISQ